MTSTDRLGGVTPARLAAPPPRPLDRLQTSTARRVRRALAPLGGLVALVAVWHGVSVTVGNATILPPPVAVAGALREMLTDELPQDVAASLAHLGAGYGLGVLTGLVLALLAARFPLFEAVIDPLVEFLRPISAIAWIPIAILMFGISKGVPIFLIFYASLFPIFVNTLDGIRRIDPRLLQAARMLGASRRLVVSHVVLPAALPAVLAGARLSLGVAWMAMVAGELVGAEAGLGWRILWHQEFFAMDKVMATIVAIGVLGYVADAALRLLQARLLAWAPDAGGEQ